MAKTQVTIRIDGDIWGEFQDLYPRQASPMIEEYLREMVNSGEKEQVSRSEILRNLAETRENRLKSEQKERILQQKLKVFDSEMKENSEKLNSDQAKMKKEAYFKLKSEERILFGDICNEIKSLNLPNFDKNIIPFDFYFDFNDEKVAELLNISEELNAFSLISAINQYISYKKKENLL